MSRTHVQPEHCSKAIPTPAEKFEFKFKPKSKSKYEFEFRQGIGSLSSFSYCTGVFAHLVHRAKSGISQKNSQKNLTFSEGEGKITKY